MEATRILKWIIKPQNLDSNSGLKYMRWILTWKYYTGRIENFCLIEFQPDKEKWIFGNKTVVFKSSCPLMLWHKWWSKGISTFKNTPWTIKKHFILSINMEMKKKCDLLKQK